MKIAKPFGLSRTEWDYIQGRLPFQIRFLEERKIAVRNIASRRRARIGKIAFNLEIQRWRNSNRSKLQSYQREWYVKNASKARDSGRRRNYRALGLEVDKAFKIYSHSDFCEICGSQVSGKKKVLDHNHQTLEIRGVLCSPCNLLIGMIEGREVRLQNALQYLTKYQVRDFPA